MLPPPPPRIIDLGDLRADNAHAGWFWTRAATLSAEGKIAAGRAGNDQRESRATVWRGQDWGGKQDLGTLRADNRGASSAHALSADGKIAAGWAHNDQHKFRATVWHGQDWGGKQDLGTWRADNRGYSEVRALSADGRIAAGRAENDRGVWRATVWYGQDWGGKQDLGTLRADNRGYSEAHALSADGKIAAGRADNDQNEWRATVWRLDAFTHAVDTAHTQQALARLGARADALLAGQRHHLQRSSQGCRAEAGRFCAAVHHDYSHHRFARGHAAGVSVGYGFSPRWRAALSLDYGIKQRLAPHYRSRNGNPALGLHSHWQHENGGFVRFATAHARHRVDIDRPVLPGAEAGSGRAQLRGHFYELAAGRDFAAGRGGRLQAYAALRHHRIRRGAYTENADIAFPAQYGALTSTDTALALGLNATLPLGGQWGLSGTLEAEQRIGGNTPRYSASAAPIGGVSHELPLSRTRFYARGGLYYAITPNLKGLFTPYIGHNVAGHSTKGASLRLEGRF